MDFLLSFRLFQSPSQLKPSRPIEYSNLYWKRSTFVKFLFLTVDNTVWKYIQTQLIIIRFMITTFTVTFMGIDTTLFGYDFINMFCDVLYLVDFISALIFRCKWPKESKQPESLKSHVARLVWRNSLYKPRKIWMLIIDGFTLIPFELIRFMMPVGEAVLTACYYVAAIRVYRIFVFYVIYGQILGTKSGKENGSYISERSSMEYEKVKAVEGGAAPPGDLKTGAEGIKRIFLRKTTIIELVLKFGTVWLLLSHIFTCVYHWVAWYNNSKFRESAMSAISFNSNNGFHWYAIIFYVIQFEFQNIGFGDIPPASDEERLVVAVVSLVGFGFLNGYIISTLTNALTEKFRSVHALRLRLALIKYELGRRKLPEEKIKKIIEFYQSLWTLRKGVGSTNQMLISLPNSLWSQVYCDIFMPALNASLLFRSCDEFSKRAIAKAMHIELYMAGDIVLKRNEINSKLFYVRKGTIQIMSYQDDETQIMTFGAGSVFGQIALLLSLPARSEIHAATFCEIHSITRKRLFNVLCDFSKAKEIVINVHKNLLLNVFADKFKNSSDSVKSENVLTSDLFYKIPTEATTIARNDICVVNTCPYVFEPRTIYLKCWDAFTVIVIVVIAFFYPYCAVFVRKYPIKAEPFIIITDIILLLNLYLSFSTAILKENILFSRLRDVITTRLSLFSTYLDIVAILPIHYFLDHNSRLKPIVLCLRCLESYKIHFWFMEAETSVNVRIVGILRLVKYALYFFLIAYITGVIFYMQACYEDPCIPDSWYVKNIIATEVASPTWVSIYLAMMIVSTTGYSEIIPKNLQDVLFVVATCLVGVFLFMYLISEFSANLSLSRHPSQNFLGFAERVNSFLITHKMSSNEILRVRQFLNLRWQSNMGYEFSQKGNLFQDTPKHLLVDISQSPKFKNLQNLEIFKGMNEDIISYCLINSTRMMLPPHEVVVYAGEVMYNLIMIEEGFCEVTYGKDVSSKQIIGAGKDICTVELMSGLTSLCNVRTLTHCTFLIISKEYLVGALSLNPLSASDLLESVKEFQESPLLKEIIKTRPTRLHLVVHSTAQKSLYRFRTFLKRGENNELREPFMRLGLCQGIRIILGRATVLPYGKLLKFWELSRCFFAFCSAMLFPLLPFFQLQVPALFYVGIFLDITAWIDLYFRIHVCYYNKRNLLVTHPLWTASHYLKGSFILDFIFSFPFDRIMFRHVYDSEGLAYVTSIPIDFLRSLRVAQIYRIPPTVNNFGIDYLSPPSLSRVIVMMIALSLVFLNVMTSIVILASINYKVDKNGNYRSVIRKNVEQLITKSLRAFKFSPDPFHVYILMFYWVCETSFFIGFGDLTAETKELMIFNIMVTITSYLYFSYVIIVIASYLSSVNLNLTLYQKRMGHLIKFLKKENVIPLLRQHIVNHFEYTWKKGKGMDAKEVVADFNVALQNDVLLYLYENTLLGVGAFSYVDRSFIRIISNHVHEVDYISGAAIYKNKDIITQIYIIHQGEVTLVGKNEDETITLGVSQIFGHFDNSLRGLAQNSAVATKNVSVLCIETKMFYKLFAGFHGATPESERNDEEKAKEALVNSNNLKLGGSEKMLQPKIEGSFAYLTYKYSKYILIFYLVLSWFSINEVSYNLAFQSYSIAFACVIVPVELLFIFKIFLGFYSGFVNNAGDFVTDLHSIRKRYMRLTGFYLDFFTVIPFEVFAFAFKKQDQQYAATLFRVTKYLRARNIQYFFNLKFDTLSVNMVFFKFIAVTVWSVTLLHQCTCIWFFVSCHRTVCPDSVTWKKALDGDFHIIYLNCFYFVVIALTATGMGDITAHTIIEIFFVEALACFSFFTTAIFIGQITSTIHKYLLAKTNYEFEVKGMKTYLHVNEVSKETQDCIFRYIANIWQNEYGLQIPQLLKNGPSYLINEIKQSTYGHHIHKNPVFKACDPFFRKKLINKLIRTVYFTGDIIVNEGEINRTMYFVHVGLVESKDLARALPKKIYRQTTFFGLRQGVFKKLPHTRTYIAKTTCIILSLELNSWNFLVEFYPKDMEYVRREVKDNKWT